MDFQFYPTPPGLAKSAWLKFKNKQFGKVLEPSAGNGDLADAHSCVTNYGRRDMAIDCCEIDATKHGILREKKYHVVGLDFLQFGDGAIYSHIILNPPFAEGAKHVLQAWNMLWDGEIVAIINAETVRNPCSGERALLANLIRLHGEVEFIQQAFTEPDTQRKTDVEIALVYLRKEANIQTDIIGNLFNELREDTATKENLAADYHDDLMPALPNSSIENAVLTFNAAVRATRDAAFSEARAMYYTALLGDTMAVRNGGKSSDGDENATVSWVQSTIAKNYAGLKDRAWASILRSTNVTAHLSSSAQRRLESEFAEIKKLEFTVRNIYGFLCGLMEKQGEIQIEMACDIFDLFTRYHSDNTVFYKGWKSNSKHRTCGMRLRTTRFILPGHSSYSSSMKYESMQMLRDFDKVFAMLDGKRQPETGLVDIFNRNFTELRDSQRVSSSYFDIRYYPRAGTIHFFARDKVLVDRLNRLVGRHREWLPPEDSRVSKAFWVQFERAEAFDKELRAEVGKLAKGKSHWGWRGPLDCMNNSNRDDAERERAQQLVDDAATIVLERHGINVDSQIEGECHSTLLLQAA